MLAYCAALGLTLAVEAPAYAAMMRRVLAVPADRGLAAGALVNLASHPLAFLVVLPRLAATLGFVPGLVVVEASVWMFETALLRGWLRRDGDLLALAALTANVLSLCLGLAVLG